MEQKRKDSNVEIIIYTVLYYLLKYDKVLQGEFILNMIHPFKLKIRVKSRLALNKEITQKQSTALLCVQPFYV